MKTKKNLKSKLLTFLALLLVTGQAVLPSSVVMADVLDTKTEMTQEKPSEEQNEITEVQKEESKEEPPIVPNETDKVDKVLDEVAKGNDSPLDKNEELSFEEFLSKNQLVMGDDGNIYTTTESSYVNGLNLNDQLSSKLPQSRSLRGSEVVNVPSSANIADVRVSFSNGNSEYGWFGKRNSSNEVLWCIQQGVAVNMGVNGGYYLKVTDTALTKSISLATYFGYYIKGQNLTNEFLTQLYVYELQGINVTSLSGVLNMSDYNAHKKYIQEQIKKYNDTPKLDKDKVEVKVNESITVTDTKGVLSNYENTPYRNDTGAKVVKNGNKITVTPDKNSKSGYVYFKYDIKNNYNGTPVIYEHLFTQNTILGRLVDPNNQRVYVDVIKQGNVQFKKIDEHTKQALPNAKFKLTYNGKTENVIANDKGIVELKDLDAGTKGTIQEVQAPNGYFLNAKEYPFTVVAGETIVVEITNKKLQGQVTVAKTGELATSVQTKETEYGKLYQFDFTQEALKEATFDIFADEDVVTGDQVTQFKKDDKVTSFTTDVNGKATSSPLYIGKYRAVEVGSPNGYDKDIEPIHFEIKDEGQLVELTQTAIEAQNNWNTAKVTINKVDEKLVGYENNQAVIEEVSSNDKLFGLFKREAYMNQVGEELIPAGGLVGLAKTKNGQATFEGKYPAGEYYALELDEGTHHVANEKEYPVDLTPTDNRKELESNVWENDTFLNNQNFNRMARQPIVNKLFLTDVPFEKMNETSQLKEKSGYVYAFNQLGEGAEFELKNADQQPIQQVTIGKDGMGVWKDLVVGTYFFQETKTANDSLVLDKTIYRIEVSKKATTIFNHLTNESIVTVDNTLSKESESEKELDQQSENELTSDLKLVTTPLEQLKEDSETDEIEKEEEPVKPVLTLKNRAIRGTAELEKTDISTGKLLPDTGIRITDEHGKVVVEGRTDSNGKFTFDELPKGTYNFIEFDAPKGYLIDTTPVPFEIKADGEVIKCQMTNVKEVDTFRQTKAENTTHLMVTAALVLTVSLMSLGVIYYRKETFNQN
ncbi:collagen binding domain-containing protein [uncultured Vagococcus sp.]|uniref:MSCRAMM family protein n=1 Tax=uncultured Vagococcus sp. TaxID=189676 RepID=UPI002583462B|nr:SpaA isopeptide-forming pilin-related protein [uncultured Vagococcus sp.]